MENNISDKHIHDGHRSRMRAKLLAHGADIFDTYELLEMLLYYTVPCKDTNPVSKRLLYTFGDLDGVFSASTEDLVKVNGVGEKTARFIKTVDEIADIIGAEIVRDQKNVFADYNDAGTFFVNYLRNCNEKKIVAAYLDNNLNLIAIEELMSGVDFESAAVTPKPFVDGAIKNRASVIAAAHNHPYGPYCPTSGDRETHRLVCDTLDRINIAVLEHYVISGNCFAGLGPAFSSVLCQSPCFESFMRSKKGEEALVEVSKEELERIVSFFNTDDFDYLKDLLSYLNKTAAEDTALKLMRRFHTVEETLYASTDELFRYGGEGLAVFVKLMAFVTSRRKIDKYDLDKCYTEKEIADYLKSLYLGLCDETVYLLCFDGKRKFKGTQRLSVGTVNSTDVIPRKVLECAIRNSSKSILIAHNHPSGKAEPSSEDINFTAVLFDLLRDTGIEVLGHSVISGRKCFVLERNSFLPKQL